MFFSKKNRIVKSIIISLMVVFCVCLDFARADTFDAPSNISIIASCQENDSIMTITWEHIFGQNVADYYIYRDGAKIGWNFIIEEAAGVFLSWTDYSVVSGNTHTYYIRAINSSDELSNPSGDILKTAPFCPLPTLSLSTDCYGLSPQIRLDWTTPDNVNYIDLYRSNNFCVANTEISCASNNDCPSEDCFSNINQFPSTYFYWINKNLDNSQNYTYYIRVLGEGWDSESEKDSIVTLNCADSINPSPPPELTITPTCAEDIKTIVLEWTRSENIDKYIIHKDSSEGYYIQDNIAQSGSPSYNDGGSIGALGEIVKDRIYTYRVEAQNNDPNATSAYSDYIAATFTQECSGQSAPDNPTNLVSESRCNAVDPIMRISWDAPTTGGSVNNYVIYRSVNSGSFNYYISIADTSYDDPNVIIGKAVGYYKYQIEARGIGGASPEPFPEISSQEVSNCVPPVSPTMESPVFHCSAEENPFVRIEWSQGGGADPDTDYFNIYRKLDGGEWGLIESTANNSIYLWDDDGVASNIPSNNYFYYVKAVGFGAGDSFSNEESVSVSWCDPTVPTASLSKTCDGSGSSLIGISWTASNNLDHYEVLRDGTELVYSGTDTSYQDTVSGAINTYFYEVKAVGKNAAEIIDTESITTDDCAILTGAPNIDAVNSESKCESSYYPYFYLVWDQVSGAEYYQVYRQKDATGETEELIYTSAGGTTISYDDTQTNNPSILRVESGADYYYRVAAIKAGVSSISSDAVLFSIDWCAPSSPINLNDVQSCSGTQHIIDITWDESLNTANYEIYRKSDNSAIILSDVPIGTNLADLYQDNTAAEGTTYYYTVRSIGKDGINIADSTAYQVDTGYCITPDQPVIQSVSSECDNFLPYVSLTWNNIANAEYYELHRIFNSNNEIVSGCDILSCEDSGVNSSSTYTYYVLACNMSGCSARTEGLDPAGNDKEIEVEWCPPPMPDSVTATAFCNGMGYSSVSINWPQDTTGNVDHYELSRDGGSSNLVVLANNLPASAISYINNQAGVFPPEDSISYTYTLKIVGKDGTDVYVDVSVATYDCTLPGIPTIDTDASIFQCDIFEPYVRLEWLDSIGATDGGYRVLRNGVRIDLPEDIVGLWHFNENSGIIAYDKTVNNNDGNLNNMDNSNWVQSPSIVGSDYALEFDGLNEYVNITDNNTGLDINGSFTFSVWVYPHTISGEDIIFCKESAYEWALKSGRLSWAINNSSPGWAWRYTDIYPAINTWTHIAIVYDQNSVKAYENGVQIGSPIVATGAITANNNPLRIGAKGIDDSNSLFDGIIDEVKIVSRALTQAEIQADYQKLESSLYQNASYDDYGVVGDNTYNYEIIARNLGGISSDTLNNIYVDWCPPAAPSNLQASKDCDGFENSEITLSWDADLSNAVDHYRIVRTNGGTAVLENNLDGSSASYLDSSPPNNSTIYDYSVVAAGKEGSFATSTVNITTDDCSLPNIDPNVTTATTSCNNSIPYGYLEWDSVFNADYYEIYRDATKIASTQDTVALWHFNEASGIVYDETDNNNDGNLINGINRAADQWGGNALSFDGDDDYIAIQNLHYSIVGEISEITACSWIKTNDQGRNSIIDFDRSDYWSLGVNFENTSGEEGMISWDTTSSGGSINDMASTVRVDDNNWHYVCGIFNSSEIYDKKIYIDGILDKKINAYPTGVKLGIGSVRYGFIGDGSEATSYNGSRNGNYFNGLIDEIIILNRALSGAEILANYQTGELNYLSPVNNFYKDYSVVDADIGIYLGNSFDYYIKACNIGGCVQGAEGNVIFNNPNNACNPFTAISAESEARCELDGFGGIDVFADLRWYDFFPDSASDYEVLISGNSTSTTAENYNSDYEKEYIDFEKILDESFEGNAYSFVLRSNPKNPIFTNVDSASINLSIPNCYEPTKPVLGELIYNCNDNQPKIEIIWEDSDYAISYDLYEINKGLVASNIADDNSPNYSITDTVVALDTAYNYYVKAYGDSGAYNISDTASITTPSTCYDISLKPIISSAASNCDNSSPRKPYIEIKWDRQAEDNNTDYYEIWRSGQPTRLNIIDILDDQDSFNSYDYIGTDSKGIDSSVVTNVQYKYYLIGIGFGGSNQSEDSEFITVPDCEAMPEIPENFSAAANCYGYCGGGSNDGEACNNNSDCDSNNCIINFIDGTSMVLNWDRTSNTFQYIIHKDCGDGYQYDSTIDEVGYNAYDPNNPDIIYTTSSVTHIAHLSEEYIGKDCFYDVKSVGWGGISTSTDLIGDTVKICGNTPMAAQSFNFSNINCEDVELTWVDGTDIGYIGDGSDESAGEFYFQAYRADGDVCGNYINVSGDLSSSNENIARSYTDSGLNEEKDYCWKMVSWNPAGSATTSFITTQTPKCPPGPSVLQKDLLNCEKISLKWKRSENYLFKENATDYELYSGTKAAPKETLKEILPACRCVDYSAGGGCSGFSAISDGAGAGNCDSDNDLFCADADNCCNTDCDASFFCDGSGNQLKCYNLTDKIYYYREINSDGFTPGGIYYYILEVDPLEIGLEGINSNQLKVQPCPELPEWREVGF